jgi:hypothetical protein
MRIVLRPYATPKYANLPVSIIKYKQLHRI